MTSTAPVFHRHQPYRSSEGTSLLQAKEGKPNLQSICTEFEDADTNEENEDKSERTFMRRSVVLSLIVLSAAIIYGLVASLKASRSNGPLTIDNAEEHTVEIEKGLSLWYRVWGNARTGVPVLFVHGGPGNAVADYSNVNQIFFDPKQFYVIEIDQRGTGKSQPSVRDDWRNMELYDDISIEKMSRDFEVVREHLNIDRWLVFGGSWGSTLGLDYALRYPRRCLGLIIRAIYLNTFDEFDAVFSQKLYKNNQQKLKDFNDFFDLAAREAAKTGEELDPNDGERIVRFYERMIVKGDQDAIWRWWVFEENIMEPDLSKHYDPQNILEEKMPEANSVSFFETRLFLHGAIEHPVDLLKRLDNLNMGGGIHTWICQGALDEACPEQFAIKLLDGLHKVGVPHTAHFLHAGHAVDIPGAEVLQDCLKRSVTEFIEKNRWGNEKNM